MRDSDTEYDLYIFNGLSIIPIIVIGFVLPGLICAIFPYKVLLLILIPSTIIGYYITYRYGFRKVNIKINNSLIFISFYNILRTKVSKERTVEFSNIKAVKKLFYGLDSITIKQNKGKTIKLTHPSRFGINDDFYDLWEVLRKSNFLQKNIFQKYSVQLFFVFIGILILSIIGLIFIDLFTKIPFIFLLSLSISGIMILFENQEK